MRYRTTAEKRAERLRILKSEEIRSYFDSKPERRNEKAYKKFKTMATDYGSGKIKNGSEDRE